MSTQTIEADTSTQIRIEREDGAQIFTVVLTDDGPRACGGRLFAELGSGERVVIFDPLRFFDEIWTHGKLAGLREKAAE